MAMSSMKSTAGESLAWAVAQVACGLVGDGLAPDTSFLVREHEGAVSDTGKVLVIQKQG